MGLIQLGLDIDNVIVPTAEEFLKFFNKKNNTNYAPLDIKEHDFTKSLGITFPEEVGLWKEFYQTDLFRNLSLYPEVYDALCQLSKVADVNLKTSRADSRKEETEAQIKPISHLIKSIAYCNYYLIDKPKKTKAESCLEGNVVLLVDDCLQYVDECLEKGIHAILFDRNNSFGWAKKEPNHKKSARITSLYEIKPYVENVLMKK